MFKFKVWKLVYESFKSKASCPQGYFITLLSFWYNYVYNIYYTFHIVSYTSVIFFEYSHKLTRLSVLIYYSCGASSNENSIKLRNKLLKLVNIQIVLYNNYFNSCLFKPFDIWRRNHWKALIWIQSILVWCRNWQHTHRFYNRET